MLDINFLRLEFAAKIQGKAGEKGSLDAALLRVATLAYQQGAIDSHAIHLRPLVIPIGVYPDSERLDWIGEQYLRVGSLGLRSDGRDFEITPAAGGRFKGATLREAIDEAMAAEELARLTAETHTGRTIGANPVLGAPYGEAGRRDLGLDPSPLYSEDFLFQELKEKTE